jgi:hypothetical protein
MILFRAAELVEIACHFDGKRMTKEKTESPFS